jgi:hypothetical protein
MISPEHLGIGDDGAEGSGASAAGRARSKGEVSASAQKQSLKEKAEHRSRVLIDCHTARLMEGRTQIVNQISITKKMTKNVASSASDWNETSVDQMAAERQEQRERAKRSKWVDGRRRKVKEVGLHLSVFILLSLLIG